MMALKSPAATPGPVEFSHAATLPAHLRAVADEALTVAAE
jgi:hypothetical protein